MYKKTHALVESAIMIALATVLSYVKVWEMPMGRAPLPCAACCPLFLFRSNTVQNGGWAPRLSTL